MDNIIMENACSGDIEFIKKLEVESGLSTWSKDDYLQEIHDNNELFLVVKKDQKPFGFLLARLIMIEQTPSVRYEAEIYNIAVSDKYRREKIASQLLRKLIEKANKYKVEKIYLEVRESNLAAQRFYLCNLFKIVGKRKNFYSNPSENAILMCRELPEEESV